MSTDGGSWAPFGPSGDDEERPASPPPEPVVFEPPVATPPPPSQLDRPTPEPPSAPAAPPPPVSTWPGPPPAPYGAPRRTAGTATASLVLGIVGLVLFPLIASIPAIVLGRRARREIGEHPNELTGRGLATWGTALGWIGAAWGALIVLVVLLGGVQ